MNIPKPYAAAIVAVGAAVSAAAYYYPALLPFSAAVTAIIGAFIGDRAHNALPPVKS